jgi:hypothetical protein
MSVEAKALEEVVLVMLKHGVLRAEVGAMKVELHPAAANKALLDAMPRQKAKIVEPDQDGLTPEDRAIMFAHVDNMVRRPNGSEGDL